jgi:lysophospholipase L1-like esterase
MKTVLLFGDSNTWGYVPGSAGERQPYSQRTAGVLQAALGADVRILEEGLNGRMTAWDDPLTPDRNGLAQLPAMLETHRPLDLVSLMLGTNDLKRYMNLGPAECALGLNALIDIVSASGCGPRGQRPKILIIAPPRVVETATPFGRTFDDAIPKSHGFAAAYAEVAAQRECLFLDASTVASASARDGIHFDAEAHGKMGRALAALLERELRP